MTLLITTLIFSVIMQQADSYTQVRNRMVKVQISDRGIKDQNVLDAMRRVPRHLFVPEEYREEAYNDYPLPIGYSQTISQPYIVAYMTAAVRPDRNMKALEIGTGSGYQAAVLANVVKEVYSVEIVPELARESMERLKKLGFSNVTVREGDGYEGWKEEAPFDIIIVTAAAESIPGPLIEQLAENGRLIIPVGRPSSIQELQLIIKRKGKIEIRKLSLVRFVPFVRQR